LEFIVLPAAVYYLFVISAYSFGAEFSWRLAPSLSLAGYFGLCTSGPRPFMIAAS
jgi:hypothetical protein